MLTPEQFWNKVSQWGSYISDGDPSSCLYTFDERGLVQSEHHRATCIAHLDGECREAALCNEDPAADDREIDELIAYLRAAPITPWTPNPRFVRAA